MRDLILVCGIFVGLFHHGIIAVLGSHDEVEAKAVAKLGVFKAVKSRPRLKNVTNKYKISHLSSQLVTHFNDNDDKYEGRIKQLTYNALITNFNYPKGYKDENIYKIIKDEDIHYVGLFRNLIEGGKPELCYILDLELTRDELVARFNEATDKEKKKRGVDKIVTFRADEFEILEDDKVDFGNDQKGTVPLVGMYILEKIKDM